MKMKMNKIGKSGRNIGEMEIVDGNWEYEIMRYQLDKPKT